MIEFLIGLFAAIAALPKLAGYAERFAQGVMAWYVNRANDKTLAQIAEAAAFAARAETADDRRKALDMWSDALGRSRRSL